MFSSRLRMFLTMTIICSILVGCNFPSAATSEPPTVQALPTQTKAPTETPLPPATATLTVTETLAATQTDTLTPEPSLTSTETVTPTQSITTASVVKETNCRSGPGQMYDRLATFQAGVVLEVTATDLGGGYWYVKNPEKPDTFCWVWGSNLKIEGDTSLLPALTPPATPTPSPDFDVKFKNFDKCKDHTFARFIVVNTGGFQFRSAYVKVTDQKTGEATENSVNAFDLTVGCIVAQNIAPLTAGSTGYLQSDYFKKDPRNDKLRAVLMLCTEQGLQGTCMTKVIDIKP